jgi:hypothetical protein
MLRRGGARRDASNGRIGLVRSTSSFLTERPNGFGRLAGPSLAFRVRGELVNPEGFAGVQGSTCLNQLGELLDRLSRSARLTGVCSRRRERS